MSASKNRINWLALPVTFAALYGVYLLFVSTLSKTELIAGLGAAAIAAIAAEAFGIIGVVKLRPALRDLAQGWRIGWYAIRGTLAIFHGLALQLFTRNGAPSLVRAVRFEGGDDARAQARRTLAITYTTMTPNSIVLGFIHHQQLMLYHQILPTPAPRTMVKLRARA